MTATSPPEVCGQHCFVVPAYGRSPHLVACLDSLRRQTLVTPVIVSTSTPYDGLADMVAGHGAELAVHSGEPGIGRDWNRALSVARARWVTLAHQDDVYLPDFTARTLDLIRRTPDAALVFTDYLELTGETPEPRSPMLKIKRLLLELGFLGRDSAPTPGARARLLRFGCPIPCPSVTLRLGGSDFRFREDMKVNLDWDAWSRLAARPGAFGYCRDALVLHRIHRESETSVGVRDGARAREDRLMFERYWPRPVAAALARVYALSYRAGAA